MYLEYSIILMTPVIQCRGLSLFQNPRVHNGIDVLPDSFSFGGNLQKDPMDAVADKRVSVGQPLNT